jgi:hypothetical protein
MRIFRNAFIALVAIFALNSASCEAKSIKAKVYTFGFSASFNDTTVYITNIQAIDSAWVTSKNKFLLNRNNYSLQLKDYLEGKLKLKDRTCIIISNVNKKKLEKKYMKMKHKYINNKDLSIIYLSDNDFKFTRIAEDPNEEIETPKLTKEEKKKQREEQRKADKDKRTRPMGGPGMGGPGGMNGGGPEGGEHQGGMPPM